MPLVDVDVPSGAAGAVGPADSPGCGPPTARPHVHRTSVGRRGLQVVLGVLWMLDGALQLQPALLTDRFARSVLAPAAVGQPGWVSWPVLHAARVIGAHALAAGVAVALVQMVIGAGLLVRRTVRPALVASVAWAAGVWVVGEGLGGIAGGTASFLTGAPGAALLYALLASAAWPAIAREGGGGSRRQVRSVPDWFPRAWAVGWVALGASALLPANRSGDRVAGQLLDVAGAAPRLLARLDRVVAELVRHAGTAGVVLLVLGPMAIGLCGLSGGRVRRWAAWSGIALAAVTWVVGESLGQLASGSATDPNTAPLLALAGVALLGTVDPRTSDRHRAGVIP